MRPGLTALVPAILLMTSAQPSLAQSAPVAAAAPAFAQDSLNVYRRFPPEQRSAMLTFYDKVLELQPLQPINLGGGQQMILFKVGTGQVKLASGLKADRKYHLGTLNEATGIRLFTLYFPDEAALAARFKAAGAPAPAFKDRGDGIRAALVQDPGGFWLELAIAPDKLGQVEVGINASDLAKSRAFYREFVGLEERPPVKDKLLGVTRYPYRHGTTTINLWSVGKNLPADTGSAGVQYVISNVDAVDARGKAAHVPVEQALGDLPGFALRTVWLNDPDGVTNYFAQVGPRPSAK